MNRLHAEGERRSNDFGHRGNADRTARRSPHQYTTQQKNVSKKRTSRPSRSAHPERRYRNLRRSIEASVFAVPHERFIAASARVYEIDKKLAEG
jgi:hypothetical protein